MSFVWLSTKIDTDELREYARRYSPHNIDDYINAREYGIPHKQTMEALGENSDGLEDYLKLRKLGISHQHCMEGARLFYGDMDEYHLLRKKGLSHEQLKEGAKAADEASGDPWDYSFGMRTKGAKHEEVMKSLQNHKKSDLSSHFSMLDFLKLGGAQDYQKTMNNLAEVQSTVVKSGTGRRIPSNRVMDRYATIRAGIGIPGSGTNLLPHKESMDILKNKPWGYDVACHRHARQYASAKQLSEIDPRDLDTYITFRGGRRSWEPRDRTKANHNEALECMSKGISSYTYQDLREEQPDDGKKYLSHSDIMDLHKQVLNLDNYKELRSEEFPATPEDAKRQRSDDWGFDTSFPTNEEALEVLKGVAKKFPNQNTDENEHIKANDLIQSYIGHRDDTGSHEQALLKSRIKSGWEDF